MCTKFKHVYKNNKKKTKFSVAKLMPSRMEVKMSNNLYCEMCLLQFDKKIVYDIHMSFVHKKEQTETMKALIKEETEDLVQDINLEIKEKPNKLNCSNRKALISCSICQVSFSRKSSLKRHIEAVHEKKKAHKCLICDSNFSSTDSLKQHITTVHEGKKPHKCLICDSNFSSTSDLKRHIAAVHEGTKPHKCSICDYAIDTRQYF